MSSGTIKRGLLTFWGVWTGLVFASNATDGLKRLHVLSESWPFASGNYKLIIKVTGIYYSPEWIVAALFCGVLGWQAAGTCWYIRAAVSPSVGVGLNSKMLSAFGINLALWAAFMIADEVFLAYPMENVHRAVFIAQLITLLGIGLLDQGGDARS